MTANKQIRDVYQAIFEELISSIKEDSHLRNMYNLTSEHIEYLENEWRKKLQTTGVFNAPFNEYIPQILGKMGNTFNYARFQNPGLLHNRHIGFPMNNRQATLGGINMYGIG